MDTTKQERPEAQDLRALTRPIAWGEGMTDILAAFAVPAGTATLLLTDIEGSSRLTEGERHG